MKNISRWYNTLQGIKLSFSEKIILLAPIVVWFSYYPNFHIGRAEGLNLEFSMPLIYVVILATFGLKDIWQNRFSLAKNRAVWLSGSFVVWNFLSLLWTVNPVRGFLNSGVWLVLWLCLLTLLSLKNLRKITPFLWDIFIGSALIVSVLAILQVAFGAWFDWGLCAGCLARGFGFVRPSVFAIEPQFLGSLLLAPIIILFRDVLGGSSSWKKRVALVIILMALYLTLSRGALLALFLALAVLIVVIWRRYEASLQRLLSATIVLLVISFGAGMLWHGIFTQLNPRVNDGFYEAVAKSVNQLSLGKLSLPKLSQGDVQPVNQAPLTPEPSQKALFDGYVERSTNERMTLNQLAIAVWSRDLWTMLAGVGAGGAGRALYQSHQSTGSEFEIIQNEYLSILLEIGVVGLVLFIALLAGLFCVARRTSWLWAIIVGFIVQWNFFSGLPNVIHIYLLIAVMVAVLQKRRDDEADKEAEDIA